LAEAPSAGQDVVGALGPGEGLGVLVCCCDVAANSLLQKAGAAELPAPKLAGTQQGKPRLDQVQPSAGGWGEVQMVTRPLDEPLPDQRRLMGWRIVEHGMYI